MKKTVAIDFGTRTSLISFWNGQAAEIIKNNGKELTPSIVTINGDNGKVEVGEDAIDLGLKFPEFCYWSAKRHLNRPFDAAAAQDAQMREGPDHTEHFLGPNNNLYPPTEIASWIMRKLLKAAQDRFGERPTDAVLTVPEMFGQNQRAAVLKAAEMAGLIRTMLMGEAEAAAIAAGHDVTKRKLLAIIDVGAGTTDVTIIECGVGNSSGIGLVKVLASNGSAMVGGDEWDKAVAHYGIDLWEGLNGSEYDLTNRPHVMAKIRLEAEAAKRRLSSRDDTEFRVDDVAKNKKTAGPLHMIFPISRQILDEITKDLLKSIRATCERCIAQAQARDPKFTVKDLDDVILVGGQTRTQSIRDLAEDVFRRKPRTDVEPETAVALGAAVRAAVFSGERADLSIRGITPHAIRVKTSDKVDGAATLLIPKGSPLPFTLPERFATNRDKGQGALTIWLLEGDSDRAEGCQVLSTGHVEIPPGDSRAARLPFECQFDEDGNLTARCGTWSYNGARPGP